MALWKETVPHHHPNRRMEHDLQEQANVYGTAAIAPYAKGVCNRVFIQQG